MNWQPIETALKDRALLLIDSNSIRFLGYWNDHHQGWFDNAGYCRAVTHWMDPGYPDAGLVATQAARDVLAERQRQISAEGWTPEHDDEHDHGELAQAGACYAIHAAGVGNMAGAWPWNPSWWKPKTPRKDLVRAAALILADIERLDRRSHADEGKQV